MTPVEQLRGTWDQIVAYTGQNGQIVLSESDANLYYMNGVTLGGANVAGHLVNAQTGSTYAIVETDQGRLITFANSGAVAVSMVEAVTAHNFSDGQRVWIKNIGPGTVTITPTVSTIDGAATLVLLNGWAALIVSDGTNYHSISVPPLAAGDEVVGRVLVGSAVPLTTGTPANVTSVSLSVGTWEVSGAVGFDAASGTIATEQIGAINTTSAILPTFPSTGTATAKQSGTAATADGSILPLVPCRITVASGTATVYLVAQAAFTVSTDAAYGEIRAIRVR